MDIKEKTKLALEIAEKLEKAEKETDNEVIEILNIASVLLLGRRVRLIAVD